jgi:hypothetical protein
MVEKGRIDNIYLLQGIVGKGILNRVIQHGGIPTNGPGCFSVPNALEREKQLGKQKPTSLETRRQWNRNNKR